MKLLSNKAGARINWLHKIVLLPVILLAVLSISLRFGIPVPAFAQASFSHWLQDTLGTEITTKHTHVELSGKYISMVVKGAKLHNTPIIIKQMSVRLDALDLLFNQSLSSVHMSIDGVNGVWAQSQELSWELEGVNKLVSASSLSPTDTGTDTDTQMPFQAGLSALLDSVSYIELTNSSWYIKPYQRTPVSIATPNVHLSKVSNNELLLSIEAHQDDIAKDKNVSTEGFKATKYDDITNWSITGQAWIRQTGVQTSISAKNVAITGYYRKDFLDMGADIEVTFEEDISHFQLNNIAGSWGNVSWPIRHLYGAVYSQPSPLDITQSTSSKVNQQQWVVTTPKINLKSAISLVKELDIPADIATPIEQLNPTGYLVDPYFYLKTSTAYSSSQHSDNEPHSDNQTAFLLTGHMQDVAINAWLGVPAVTNAYGGINLTNFGGKVTVENERPLNVHLPLLTDNSWQFSSVIGEVAWKIKPESTMLSSNKITLQQQNQPFYARFGGEFNHSNQQQSDLQVWVAMPNHTLKEAIPLLPKEVTIPEPIQDLDLAGYFAVDVDVAWPPVSNNDEKTVVDYTVSVIGQNLEGFWPDRAVNLNQLDVNLSINPSGLQELQLQGQADSYPVQAELVFAPFYSALDNPIDVSVWDAAHVDKVQGSWLQIKSYIDHAHLLNKLTSKDLQDNLPWLPDEAGLVHAYIPMCFFEGTKACAYALGNYTLIETPITWPVPITPLRGLSFLWQSDKTTLPSHPDTSPFRRTLQPYSSLALAGQIDKKTNKPVYQANLHFEQDSLQGIGLGLGIKAPYIMQDTYIDVQSESMDLESWYTSIADIIASDEATVVPVLTSDSASNINNYVADLAEPSEPFFGLPPLVEVEASIDNLKWQNVTIEQAEMALKQEDGAWVIAMQSDTLSGHIVVPKQELPVQLNIQYARFKGTQDKKDTQDEKEDSKNVLEYLDNKVDLLENINPADVPDMDFSVKNIQVGERNYGNWQGELRKQVQSLYIQNINADFGHSYLAGNMTWEYKNGEHITYFSGSATSKTVGDALKGWGYKPTIVANHGALDVNLSWPRTPLGFSINKTKGNITLYIKNGHINESFKSLDSLKVIALLDLSRLLKTIKPDFSDVNEDALAFDSIYANYAIGNGVMRTLEPVTLVSSALEVSLQGYIDIINKELDNDLYVTLPIADKLSLVALLTGAPQLSGMLYLVEKLIGRELKSFTTGRYSLTGSLESPQLTLEKIGDSNAPPENLGERLDSITQLQ